MKRLSRGVMLALVAGLAAAIIPGFVDINPMKDKWVVQTGSNDIRPLANHPIGSQNTFNKQNRGNVRSVLVRSIKVQPLDLHHMNVDTSNRIYYTNKVVVVTFHDISPDVYSKFVITPQVFSADLDAFHQHFNVITNQQFISFLNGQGSVPPNAVLITLDDGYRDMYTYALPILVQHEMQGTFFDIVGTADHPLRNEFLTWGQIKTMVHDGMCFESHTYHEHYEVIGQNGMLTPVFNTLMTVNGITETPQHYYNRVYGDFTKARVELSQQIGQPVREFAWPYGYGDWLSTSIARAAGYDYLFTTAPGYVTAGSNPIFIHRIDTGTTGITPSQAVQDIINTAQAYVPQVIHYAGVGSHPGVKSHQGSVDSGRSGIPGSKLNHGVTGKSGSSGVAGSQNGSVGSQQQGGGASGASKNSTNQSPSPGQTNNTATGNTA
ncbi:polysaccharide deacetylase family protein [Alicyclobacillus ferrooxydans]|uniref:NodB homology domain-containing protein n=1 Tax=Alicyclobacillus ferrooxydans TaxID=471514 RepID=A0A0P9D389_9BACL|nr:polysaccharide deacetylase family protein [Alicyclobacillus ferrooxydans]KPV43970.1 hypothetical protein AN477_09645 [Alicyclobacillus ferrooxydans]